MGIRSLTPPRPRIKTVKDAKRCIKALQEYFRNHESPMAAEDLEDAIEILCIDAIQTDNPYV